VHLGSILRILEETQPPELGKTEAFALPYTLTNGPFAGLAVASATPAANAAYIHRHLIDTYLITHPHLDHIAGFVINTAGLPGSRPKRLAGLPSTIAAFKTHIFNNVIWPNLSDENNGAGLVTYMRLVEGGSPALGDGDGKGYLEISDGLGIKVWGVSHGHCIEKHSHRGSASSTRFGSFDASSLGAGGQLPMLSPRGLAHHHALNPSGPNLAAYLQQQQQQQQHSPSSAQSTPAMSREPTMPQTPGMPGSSAPSGFTRIGSGGPQPAPGDSVCVYDSSAYFIRDVATGREVLIFGDVEPDSISLSPRNSNIWREAAPKIASGKLAAIFIECSYDDSQSIDRLYGHLTPRFIIEELTSLAGEVEAARGLLLNSQTKERKRKRDREASIDEGLLARRKATHAAAAANAAIQRQGSAATEDAISPKTARPSRGSGSAASVTASEENAPASVTSNATSSPHVATPVAGLTLRDSDIPPLEDGSVASGGTNLNSNSNGNSMSLASGPPLRGLKVVIIHMKDTLSDGLSIGECVLAELLEHDRTAALGCEFVISHVGQSLLL
jgi:cAMP phosphodiesterase